LLYLFIMSDSFHVNHTHLKNKTRKEIDEMAKEPDSLLKQLAEKSATKEAVRKKRKVNKGKY
jgi:hypothetical protein